MDTKDFLLLKVLYEEKNITHTASRLFMSQPAISDRLHKLEQEFNCRIIIRQPRGIKFTAAGEELYRYFMHNLEEYQTIKSLLSDDELDDNKYIRLGCSNTFAKYHMPAILASFQAAYPEIKISFTEGFSHMLYKDFLNGAFDLVIIRGNHSWREQKHQIWQENLCLLRHRDLSISNLEKTPYIHYRTDPILQAIIDDWWFSKYKCPPHTILQIHSMDTCMRLVQQKIGYTILSESCSLDYPEIAATPLIQSNGLPLLRKTWLYYHNNYTVFPNLRHFIEHLHRYLAR